MQYVIASCTTVMNHIPSMTLLAFDNKELTMNVFSVSFIQSMIESMIDEVLTRYTARIG